MWWPFRPGGCSSTISEQREFAMDRADMSEWVSKPPMRYLNPRCVKSRNLLPERHQQTSPGQSDAVSTAERRPGFVELPFSSPVKGDTFLHRRSHKTVAGASCSRSSTYLLTTWRENLNDLCHEQPHRSAPLPPAQRGTRTTDCRLSRSIANLASDRFD